MDRSLEEAPARPTEGRSRVSQKLLAAGGLVGALGASSCCIAPLVLFSLGISGAWIGNLTALAPYQPIFVVAALAFLAAGFYRVYCQPTVTCADGSCARPLPNRLVKGTLWAATLLVGTAIAFPYLAPLFLYI